MDMRGKAGYCSRMLRAVLTVGLLIAMLVTGCTSPDNLPGKLENTPVSLDGHSELLGPTLTKEQALEDFRYLFERLRDYHPYIELKKRVEGYDWLAHEDEFQQKVLDAEINEDFAKAIAYMVFALNNGHTSVASGSMVELYMNTEWRDVARTTTKEKADYWYALTQKPAPGSETNWTPFIAQYIGGEYVVTQVAPDPDISSKATVGYKVKSINGIPVDEFVASHRGSRFLPFDPERGKLYYADRLRFPPPFPWSTAEFIDPQGQTISVDMNWASQAWNAYFLAPPFYVTEPNTMNAVKDPLTCVINWSGTKVGYVYIPSMKRDWGADMQVLAGSFRNAKDLPAIILDLRTNSGGSTEYWLKNIIDLLGAPAPFKAFMAIRRKLVAAGRSNLPVTEITAEDGQNLPPELLDGDFVKSELRYFLQLEGDIGYRGKLNVLTSRTIYSAAETFVVACKATGLATLVGTYTGGDGIGVTPGLIVLPNSGLTVRFPVDMGLNPDGLANEEYHTKPDVMVDQSPEDLLKWLEVIKKEGFPTAPQPEFDTVLRECLNLATGE